MKKHLGTLWWTLPAVLLLAWGALTGQGSLGQIEKPLVRVFSATNIRTPSSQGVPVGVQLWTASGKPLSQAEVLFGMHPLLENYPGHYHADIDLTQFSIPLIFTITIPDKSFSAPSVPQPQTPIVIRARLNSNPNPVRITSPVENQVFHRSQSATIPVQWQLASPVAVTLSWADNDTEYQTTYGTVTLPAGTTSYPISMSSIPASCAHLYIGLQGHTYNFKIEGPVTSDSKVSIGSESFVRIGLVN